ncbi:hypothetical protein HN803_04320 [candidate division WWE3 bacterium]|jgi:hypothetical protein|nr:hypothetical protein [candidate division WWE3 bacterium]
MSKNGGKQSIFATTQVEMFIVIIFILLAISHVSMNESNAKNNTLDSLNAEREKSLAALDSVKLLEAEQAKIVTEKEKIVTEKEKIVTELEREIRRLKGDPPCRFEGGDQVLFRVQFLPGRNYYFVVQDYVPEIRLPHFNISPGYSDTMDHEEFSMLLRELYKYARDFDEPCRYVFKRFDQNNAASGFVGQEPLYMLEFVNRYMYQRL